MLVTLSEILQLAEAKKCAVGSFNTPNLESIMAVIGAAEELNVPVIIMHAEVHEPMMPISVIGPIMIERAKAAKVPVCVHLDHGETLAYLDQALNIGFTSVMFDGSALPYEENVANTKIAVKLAHAKGASVEAELEYALANENLDWDMTTEYRQAMSRRKSIQIRNWQKHLLMKQVLMHWLVHLEQHMVCI